MLCARCGKRLTCECAGKLVAPEQVQTDCNNQTARGDVWVYVEDEQGNGVGGCKIVCAGADPNTDAKGFAPFRDLTCGNHAVRVDAYPDTHEAAGSTSAGVIVRANKTSLCEFYAVRRATLVVKVKVNDPVTLQAPDVKPLPVGTKSGQHIPTAIPTSAQANQPATFTNISPGQYNLSCTANGQHAQSFVLDGDASVTLAPGEKKEITVQLTQVAVLNPEVVSTTHGHYRTKAPSKSDSARCKAKITTTRKTDRYQKKATLRCDQSKITRADRVEWDNVLSLDVGDLLNKEVEFLVEANGAGPRTVTLTLDAPDQDNARYVQIVENPAHATVDIDELSWVTFHVQIQNGATLVEADDAKVKLTQGEKPAAMDSGQALVKFEDIPVTGTGKQCKVETISPDASDGVYEFLGIQ